MVACAVETTSDDSFGDVTGNGTDVSTTMRLTAAEDSGSDEGNSTTVGTSITTSNDDTDTAPAECPAEHQCVTAVPDDWFGPIAVHMGEEDETPPECPESFPNTGPTMLSGYTDPGPAVCECECLLDVASSCYSYAYDMDASCTGDLQVYQSGDCTGAAQNAALNACTPGITGGQSVSIAFTGDGGCPVASPPEAQGAVAAMGETTYCCTQ
jgi:hypothetical protein